MNKKMLILVCAGFLASCASLRDAGRAYFKPTKKYSGVQSPEEVIKRVNSNKKIRHIIYGSLKENKIITCTFLRNQVYIASMMSLGKADEKELKQVSDLLEHAYQQDDQAFLAACDQVKNTKVGRLFSKIQEEYIK